MSKYCLFTIVRLIEEQYLPKVDAEWAEKISKEMKEDLFVSFYCLFGSCYRGKRAGFSIIILLVWTANPRLDYRIKVWQPQQASVYSHYTCIFVHKRIRNTMFTNDTNCQIIFTLSEGRSKDHDNFLAIRAKSI